MLVHYLVRHGNAVPGGDDRSRPLSDRGREEVRRVARHAATLGLRVAEIRHSGLLRARQTAEILAEHLATARGIREMAGLAPNDDPASARAELEAARESVMLVGHLPHLGRLASSLILDGPGRDIIRFAAGAVVGLAKTNDGWVVGWVVTPELTGPS